MSDALRLTLFWLTYPLRIVLLIAALFEMLWCDYGIAAWLLISFDRMIG